MYKLKFKRLIVYVVSAILAIVVIFYVSLWVINIPYRSGIPAVPDLQTLSGPLQEQIKDADKTAHRSPDADNLGFLGMVYHSNAHYDKAIDCYKLAIKKNNSKWIWKYYLGYLYKEMGESEAAIASFSSVIKNDPNISHAWYYLGEAFQNSGANEQAEIAFKKISNFRFNRTENSGSRNDLFPLEAYAKFQMARLYFNSKQFDNSETTLKDIVKNYNSFGPAYRLLANIYSTRGDSSWSKYYVLRANDLAVYSSPVDTLVDRLARISRSDVYLLKQIDEAVKSYNPDWTFILLENALSNIPDNKYIISKAVKFYLKLDNVPRALPILSRHLSMYNTDFNELKEVAGLLYDKKQYSKSLEYYSQLEKLQPDNPEIITGKALALSALDRKGEALALVSQFVEKNKKDIASLKEGIYYLIVENELDKAQRMLTLLKQLAPSDVKVYKYAGMIAETEEKYPQAIAAYETAYIKDPTDISTIQYLGNLYVQQKMWKKALDYFRKSLEKHPNEPYLLERLGTLLVSCPDLKLRNYPVAKEFSERAFINVQSSAETMISAGRSLAIAYAAMGDKENASTYQNITINLARNQNYPKQYISELESLLQ